MKAKLVLLVCLGFMVLTSLPTAGWAHCQVPCGIYDDAARIEALYEDAKTIAKCLDRMGELAGKTAVQDANQLVRWIVTKESHAANIIEIVAEYFLTQKVKPVSSEDSGYPAYLQKLADHHRVMSAAMKCKQNSEINYVQGLREAIAAMAKHYDTQSSH